MEIPHRTTPETQTPETPSYIIEYAGLVDTLQLSEARKCDIAGAMAVRSFSELIEGLEVNEQEELICQVGNRFDDALIDFIAASFMRHRDIIILAEASEGVDGYLPWEPKLEESVNTWHESGLFANRRVSVKRFVKLDNDSQVVSMLTQEAQALAS